MYMRECVRCGAIQYSNIAGPESCSACGGDLVDAARELDEALSLDPFFDASRAPQRPIRVMPTAAVNDNAAPVPSRMASPARVALVLGAVAVALVIGAGALAADDMERCQERQGFDTCFSTLNR